MLTNTMTFLFAIVEPQRSWKVMERDTGRGGSRDRVTRGVACENPKRKSKRSNLWIHELASFFNLLIFLFNYRPMTPITFLLVLLFVFVFNGGQETATVDKYFFFKCRFFFFLFENAFSGGSGSRHCTSFFLNVCILIATIN